MRENKKNEKMIFSIAAAAINVCDDGKKKVEELPQYIHPFVCLMMMLFELRIENNVFILFFMCVCEFSHSIGNQMSVFRPQRYFYAHPCVCNLRYLAHACLVLNRKIYFISKQKKPCSRQASEFHLKSQLVSNETTAKTNLMRNCKRRRRQK
jgi:hypothetical protein